MNIITDDVKKISKNQINNYLSLNEEERNIKTEQKISEIENCTKNDLHNLMLEIVENSYVLAELHFKIIETEFDLDELLSEKEKNSKIKNIKISNCINLIKNIFLSIMKNAIYIFLIALLLTQNVSEFFKIIFDFFIITFVSGEIVSLYVTSNQFKKRIERKIIELNNEIIIEKNNLKEYNNVAKHILKIYQAQNTKIEQFKEENQNIEQKKEIVEDIPKENKYKVLSRKKEN